MNSIVNWKRYLDKVYCCNYTNTSNNIPFLYNELRRVGIYDSKIFYDFFNISSPLYKLIYENVFDKTDPIQVSKCGDEYSYGFDCTFSHYFILKQAYELGYDRIAVIENDVRFLNDIDCIEAILESICNDDQYDIYVCQNSIDMFHNDDIVRSLLISKDSIHNHMSEYAQKVKERIYGAAFNIYTRNGMKTIIDKFESLKFGVIDLYARYDCNICFAYPNICTQQHLMYSYSKYCESLYNFNKYTLDEAFELLYRLHYVNTSTLSMQEIYDNVMRLCIKYGCNNDIRWNEFLHKVSIVFKDIL